MPAIFEETASSMLWGRRSFQLPIGELTQSLNW